MGTGDFQAGNNVVKALKCNDVDLAAPLIFSSGPGSLSAMLSIAGKQPIDFITYAFQQPAGQFSYSNHYGIYSDQQLVAIGSCWENPVPAEARRANLTVLVDYYGYAVLPELAARSQRIAKVIPPPNEHSLGVGHIAVNPVFRRQGMAIALLAFFRQLAHKRNKKALELDVDANNQPAIALYQAQGFTVEQRRDPEVQDKALGLVPHLHMQQSL